MPVALRTWDGLHLALASEHRMRIDSSPKRPEFLISSACCWGLIGATKTDRGSPASRGWSVPRQSSTILPTRRTHIP